MRALKLLAASVLLSSLLGLAACGGGGGYGGGGMNVAVVGVGPSKLFAADSTHMVVGSLANPNPGAGAIPVDRIIDPTINYVGFSNNIGSLTLDTTNDRLYVGNGANILVFNGASTVNGNILNADRTITGFGNTGSLFIDAAHNRLYVADAALGVKVFDPADMANGATTPNHILTGNFGTTFQISGVAVDATKDILYVSNTTLTPTATSQITLFTASTATDPATPLATITPVDSGMHNLAVAGIALDSTGDRLYVAGPAPTVMVFDGVSTLANAQTPTRTITLPGQIRSVAIDPGNDRLYAVDLGGTAIYIVANASAATGTPASVTTVGVPLINGTSGNLTAVAVNPN